MTSDGPKLKNLVFHTELRPCRWGMMFTPMGDEAVGGALRKFGEYSKVETEVLRALVRPGHIVLEAGANIGATTIPIAQRLVPNGGLIAIEPQKVLFDFLCANVGINQLQDHVRCFNYACGARPGTFKIPLYDYNKPGSNFGGLGKDYWEKYVADGHTAGYDIEIQPVDLWELPKLNLLKADVEGMEKEVLIGAAETIKRCRPILYLENDRKDTFHALIEYVWSIDYEAYWCITALESKDNFFGAEIVEGEKLPCGFNMICYPKESSFRPVTGLKTVTLEDGIGTCPSNYVITELTLNG